MNHSKRDIDSTVNEIIVSGLFQVAKRGRDLILMKMIQKKPVSIHLTRMGSGGFWINAPKYEYRCRTSHFDFVEHEQRATRRKDLLFLLVAHLQRTGLWEYIENKSFFVPNEANSRMKKKIVEDQYVFIMGSLPKKQV